MPKNNGWFKFYDRMIFSPQIVELNDGEFRLIVSLWCLASNREGKIPYSIEGIRRICLPDKSSEDILKMINHLIELDLLKGEDGNFEIPRWEIHQMGCVSKTKEYKREYMKKYREKLRVKICKNDVRNSEDEKKSSVEETNVKPVKICRNIDIDKDIDKKINNNILSSYDEHNSNGKSKNKYSDDAKSFLEMFRDYRENILKIPITKRDWHLKVLSVSEKLLKKYSLEELGEALRDLGEKKDYKVIEIYHFEDFLPKWKAEKLKEEKNGKLGEHIEDDPEYERVKKYLSWLEGTEDIPHAVIPQFL
ncbi:MAG: hypothetical protein ABDH25_04790 [Dictyoglomaceae bacterium]